MCISRNIIGMAVLSIALMGCNRETVDPEAERLAVAFSASFGSADWQTQTRATGQIDADGQLQARGFGVFGCSTGLHRYAESTVTADFMFNQEIYYADAAWQYEDIKYWPNGNPHYVSFFAYAPYSDGDTSTDTGYCIPSFSYPYEETDPWLLYRLHPDISRQVDLMYAQPLLDRTKPAIGTKLTFSFRHALACVGENVSISLSPELETELAGKLGAYSRVQLVLTGVTATYALTSKGRLSLWNRGEPNWNPVLSESPLTVRTQELFSGSHALYDSESPYGTNWRAEGKGVFYIPMDVDGFPQNVTLSLNYSIVTTRGLETTSADYTKGTVLYLRDYPAAFEGGKKLDINIRLTKI